MEILKKLVGVNFVLQPSLVGKANISVYNQTKNEFVIKNEIILLDGSDVTSDDGEVIQTIQYEVPKEDLYDIDVKAELNVAAASDRIFVKNFFTKLIEKRNGTHANLIIRDDIHLHDKENDLLYKKEIDSTTKDISFIERFWGDGATNIFRFNSPYKKAKKLLALSVNGGLSWYQPSDKWYFTYGSNEPEFDDENIVDGYFGIKIKDTPILGSEILVKWLPFCDAISIFEQSTKKLLDYAIEVY